MRWAAGDDDIPPCCAIVCLSQFRDCSREPQIQEPLEQSDPKNRCRFSRSGTQTSEPQEAVLLRPLVCSRLSGNDERAGSCCNAVCGVVFSTLRSRFFIERMTQGSKRASVLPRLSTRRERFGSQGLTVPISQRPKSQMFALPSETSAIEACVLIQKAT